MCLTVCVNKNRKDAICNSTSVEENNFGLKVHLTDVLNKTTFIEEEN